MMWHKACVPICCVFTKDQSNALLYVAQQLTNWLWLADISHLRLFRIQLHHYRRVHYGDGEAQLLASYRYIHAVSDKYIRDSYQGRLRHPIQNSLLYVTTIVLAGLIVLPIARLPCVVETCPGGKT